MIHNKSIILLLILIAVTFMILAAKMPIIKKQNEISQKTTEKIYRPNHPLNFFDKDTFYASIKQSEKENKKFTNQISGGIIPHHLYPSYIISDFFSRLSKQNPSTIILIGPNHYELGDSKVLSGLNGWETHSGIVETDERIILELELNKLIKLDEINLPKDHAVAGIMPFIKYYLPESKVVPLLVSGFMNKEDVRVLSDKLIKYVNKNTVLVAAVDFSHYLTNKKAQEKDKITLGLMKSYNYEKLLSLNNDYLDSPPSIATLLMTMQALKTTEMELLHHTNSGILQKNDSVETTSYFSIVYY